MNRVAIALGKEKKGAKRMNSSDSLVCEVCHTRTASPVTLAGQQEALICNMCFIKWKLSRLLRASGGCLGTFLIGCLVIGLVGGIVLYLIPRDIVVAASGIVSLIGGILFLGLLVSAVEPVGKAVRLNKHDLAISNSALKQSKE
jgi:hypothetical protein